MSSFIELVDLQKEWALLLQSDDALMRINIATRDYIMASESSLPDETMLAETLVYITPRNGRDGCGIIVERPSIRVPQSVSPGPQRVVALQFLVLEDRLANAAPTTGTQISGDWVGQRLIELGHHQYIEGVGEFRADANAMVEAREFLPLNAWRVTLLADLETSIPQRLSPPVITSDGENRVVLTNHAATPTAEIFYTLDGSMPARDGAGNPSSLRYVAPLVVPGGTVIRWAAYLNTYLPSQIGKATINIS